MFTSSIHECSFLWFFVLFHLGGHVTRVHFFCTSSPPIVFRVLSWTSVLCTVLMFHSGVMHSVTADSAHISLSCPFSLGMDRYYCPSSRSHGNIARMTHQMWGSSFRFPVKFVAFVVAQHFLRLTHFGFYCRDPARMTLAFRG